MEKEKALGNLFDMVFTLPQAKPNLFTTCTSTVIETNVMNIQTELISQPPADLETTYLSTLLLQHKETQDRASLPQLNNDNRHYNRLQTYPTWQVHTYSPLPQDKLQPHQQS